MTTTKTMTTTDSLSSCQPSRMIVFTSSGQVWPTLVRRKLRECDRGKGERE